jgi:hypothetical protein
MPSTGYSWYKWWLKSKVGNVWEQKFLLYEFVFPTSLICVCIAISCITNFEHKIHVQLKDVRSLLYPAFVSLFGSLFGFIITAMSIIITWADKEKFVRLRSEAGYKDFWRTFSSTIRWLGLASIASLIGMLLDKDRGCCSLSWCLTLSTIAVSLLRLARCIWVLGSLIAAFAPQIESKKPTVFDPPEDT